MELQGRDRSAGRGFWALIATQFQGAFSDNFFKWIIVYFLLAGAEDPVTGVVPDAVADDIISRSAMLFSLPFLLFPSYAGSIADRLSKQRVTVWTKVWELGVMAVGFVAFHQGHEALLWVLLFMMATQSTFFSPAKYGILPEILAEKRLSWGNGILQMGTFAAIILGTAVAGPLFEGLESRVYLCAILLSVLSLGGVGASLYITKPAPANPQQPISWNPYAGLGRYFRAIAADRWLVQTVIGVTFFWFAGLLLQQNVVKFGSVWNEWSETQVSILQAVLALGIGAGSVGAGLLSRGKIEAGLLPFGALGITAGAGLLALPGLGYSVCLALFLLTGCAAGFFYVPLAATLQHRSPESMRGGIIASSNVVNAAGMLLAGLLFAQFGRLGLTPPQVFGVIAILTFCVTAYLCYLIPVFLVRFMLCLFTSTFYRLRVLGRDNIPEKGGALFVANHTSFVDALMILASTDRQVRFIMFKGIYDLPIVRPLAKMMGVIPIAADQGPREMVKSLRAATEAIEAGEVVCIFAEGQITRTGQLLPFRKGFERIIKGTDAPIVPIHMDNLWDSIFGFGGGKFLWKLPRQIPYPVTVHYGAPLPSDTSADVLRRAVQTLGVEAFAARSFGKLHHRFAGQARRHPLRQCIADGRTEKMSYFKTLVASLALARRLRVKLGDQPMCGLLLPPSVPGALANIAAQWLGKTPVNLNYTASKDAQASACEQCGIETVLTAQAFLDKAKLDPPRPPVLIEELVKEITPWDRFVSTLWACFLPCGMIERLLGAQPDDRELATVLFSSGSEGAPKGVMLTHRNIASNLEATLQVFPHDKHDCFMGMLPLFHAIGFTATLWLPLCNGMRVVFHPNPLESRIVGALIMKHKATFLLCTSTLLQGFIRRCAPEMLSSLQHIVCGAEKLAPTVRDACKERFGVEPIEGYGATECAPLVTLNVPSFRGPGLFQKGVKHGTIGHPLPGVAVRIVDPDTGEERGAEESGMLLVSGPNVMPGYLGNPEKTAAALKDGWYVTGDIATIDADGFVTLTGRLSRFSKIAGEMVPHGVVEEKLQALTGEAEQCVAVVGLPDEAKGERLVVLHTLGEDAAAKLITALGSSDLPNLWRPAKNAFHHIDAIPVLGTGKVDLRGLKDLANETAG